MNVPRVRIVSTGPVGSGRFVTGKTQRVYVDGVEWPIVAYRVENEVDDVMLVTLTFYADATIEHADADERGSR